MQGDSITTENRDKLRQCRAILFDFGGTLDSDGEHWLDRFYELYETVGLDLNKDLIKKVFYEADRMCCDDPEVDRMGLRPLMQHHIRYQFTALNLDEAVAEEFRMVDEFCSKTEYYLRRNVSLLGRLQKHYKMGIVSNFYGNVSKICEEAGLSEYLFTILDSTQVGLSKPDRNLFERALRDLGVRAQECVFIGDSYDRDMLPARRMGMKTIWIKGPNPRLPAEPEALDCSIGSLMELESLLL